MTRNAWGWTAGMVVLLLVLVAGPASAQSIAGTVTDASGAVLPGVTVEAASPVLIERTRTVSTDEAGRYAIVNLRPGVYKVTFSLTGFSPVSRAGVELTADFTAQVSVQLPVGTMGETITVEAASPVVDVQSASTPRIVTRDMMDALPTTRSPAALMSTIPGVTSGLFASNFRNSADSLTTVDGMRATLMIGAGPSLTTASSSSNMYQEYSYSTSIDSAEMGQPGMRINLVSRDGGNEFRGSAYLTHTRKAWFGNNLDDELRAKGLTSPAKTIRSWDVNPTFGGPIMRDKIWFQTTYRYYAYENEVFNNYFDADPSPFNYVADRSRPSTYEETNYNFVQRLTWQASQKDKIAGFYDWSDQEVPRFSSPLNFIPPPPQATLVSKTPNSQQIGGKWTRTHTSRLLLEASALHARLGLYNDYPGVSEPWSARNVESLPTTRPEEYAILDLGTGTQAGISSVSDANISRSTELKATATYVTGSHALKGGVSYFTGSYHRPQTVVGNVAMQYLPSGVPNAPGIPNAAVLTLPGNEREKVDGDWAFFVQDRWSLRRLTVNAGLRLDWLMTSVPEQVLPASQWLGEIRFDKQDVLNYKDLSPRLGVAYDLFGNGKTALKAALARYVAGETVNLTGLANPIRLIATTDTRSWNDANGDRTIFNADGSVQWAELGPTGNQNFGKSVPGTVYDPEVLRGWFHRGNAWETNVSVQHELFPRVAVTGLFYRRTLGNQRTTDNQLNDPSSYDGPFCVTAPTDARLPGGGGQQICGLYDIKAAARPLVQNYGTFATNLGTGKGFKDITTGYELNVTARLPKGAFLQGGMNFQRIRVNGQRGGGLIGGAIYNTCDVIDNPEVRFCDNETPYRPDIKLSGAYMLPYDVQIAGTYRGVAGPQITASWAASNAIITPALGRPLSSGTSKTIQIMEPNKTFLPMAHIVDLRLSKAVRLSRYRIQGILDIYNAFNDNTLTGVNTTFGASYLNPTTWTRARRFNVGLQADF